MSTLLQMSFAGGMLIAAVAVLRLFLQKYIHRSVFLLLWFLAVARLLVPIITPSHLSVFNLPVFSQEEEQPRIVVITPEESPSQEASSHLPEVVLTPTEASIQTAPPMVTPEEQRELSLWQLLFCVWAGVALLLGVFFLFFHLRSRRRYRFSLPVPQGVAVPQGLRVRMLDGLSAPLTYGIFRPTVLLPVDFCWEDSSRLQHVLLHEQAHIRCHDVLKKHILLLTVCVHWFNPAVWLMFFLASQDMEIRCDAKAVKALGKGGKLPYAQTLVAAEASRMASLLDTGFSFSTTAKRLQALISAKHHPVISFLTAIALTLSLAGIFLTGEAAQAARPPVMLAPEEIVAETAAPSTAPQEIKKHELPPLTTAEPTTEAPTQEETRKNSGHSSGSNPSRIDTYSSPIFIEVVLPQTIEVGQTKKTDIYCHSQLLFYSDNKAVASIFMDASFHPCDRGRPTDDPHPIDYLYRIKVIANSAGVAHIYAQLATTTYQIATVVVPGSTGGTDSAEVLPSETLFDVSDMFSQDYTWPTGMVNPTESTVPPESSAPKETEPPTESSPPSESAPPTEAVPPTESSPPSESSPPTDSAPPTEAAPNSESRQGLSQKPKRKNMA